MKNLFTFGSWAIFFVLSISNAHALPAFAIREHVSCVMCHTNGSAPTLTRFGYLYRRAGFRFPNKMGDKEADAKEMNLNEHLAAGLNLDYEWANSTPPGGRATTTSNQINVPEVELWPLVGAFMGNFGVWSEIDASPTTTGGGAIGLSQADLRYAAGTPDLFFNFRGGMVAPEGFGASDQMIDDGGIPLMDLLTPTYNQNTLSTPFGAMNTPQLGFEFGLNYFDTHFTLGIYNGFSGVNADRTAATDVTPALMNRNQGLSKDYKLQVDQFFGEYGAVTAGYYNGVIPLMDPTGGAFSWSDHYSQGRLYLTGFVLPGVIDVYVGGALARNEFVTGSPTPGGTFQSRGTFVTLNYYIHPHLTLSGRTDYYQPDSTSGSRANAKGYSMQISLPYENNLYVFHFNTVTSNSAIGPYASGTSRGARAEWRFLF